MINNPVPLVIQSLEEMSNRDFQLQVWTGENQNMQSSLIEAAEGLFSDSGYDIMLEKHGSVFGEKIDDLLRDLAEVISATDGEFYTQDTINTPTMRIIREKSAGILKLLSEKILKD